MVHAFGPADSMRFLDCTLCILEGRIEIDSERPDENQFSEL
jgi:hypothetical protein